MITSNRPVEDWGKLLGDSAAVTAMLDRLLHHGHVLKCGPRSWRVTTDVYRQGDNEVKRTALGHMSGMFVVPAPIARNCSKRTKGSRHWEPSLLTGNSKEPIF